MICLGDATDVYDVSDNKGKLLHLLSVIASESMDARDKLQILQEEYHIEVTRNLEEEVNRMCNWSDEIWERATERGLAQGIAQGMAQGIAQGLEQGEILGAIGVYLELGFPVREIADKIVKKFAITQEEAEKYIQQKLVRNE